MRLSIPFRSDATPFQAIHSQEYRDDGVTVVRQIFPRRVVDDLKTGWETLKQLIVDGAIVRNARFVSGVLPEPLSTLYRQQSLVRAAQTLLGAGDVALYMNRILLKDSTWSGAVAIHQDMPYFSGGLEKVSVFVPLTPTQARHGNGGLIFVKGSHKYGTLRRGTIRRELFAPMEDSAPDLEIGDAVLMDFLTWHYSEQAPAPDDRPMMQIVYQPASDGSYSSAEMGVAQPTLVSGKWLTSHFAAFESTTPDA
jgi:ectoine hydroxylase-related dioxygenase (phytanoyl-CoA dioxygenase family)